VALASHEDQALEEQGRSTRYKDSRLGDAFVLEIAAAHHPRHQFLLVSQGIMLFIVPPLVICGYAIELMAASREGSSSWAIGVVLCLGPMILALVPALVCVAYALAWEFRGVETITVGREGITRTLKPRPILGAEVHYQSDREASIEVDDRDLATLRPFRQIDSAWYFLGMVPGPIVVRFGARTLRLGNGPSKSETHEVANLMRSQLNRMGHWNAIWDGSLAAG